MKEKDLKEEYIKALQKTCDNIKENADYIFQDMYDNMISKIEVKINVAPDEIVNYEVRKFYHTKFDDGLLVAVIHQDELQQR